MELERKGSYVIDSKNVCFLCLEKSLPKTFSFRSVSRFLNINLDKVFHSKLCETEGPNGHRTDVMLSLCSGCSSEAETFSKLYKELEIAEMLIYSSVQRMCDAVKRSKLNQERSKNLEEMIGEQSVFDGPGQTNQGHGASQLELLRKLREELIIKCESKLKRAGPKVEVNRLDKKVKTQSQQESVTVTSAAIRAVPDDDNSRLKKCQREEQEQHCCEYCTENFTSMDLAQGHVVNDHVDQLFQYFKKPNHLTNTQFKTAVEHVYNRMMSSARNYVTRKFKCEFCSFIQLFEEMSGFRKHLLDDHFTELAKEIEAFQNDKCEMQKIMRMRKQKMSKELGKFICGPCGKRFIHKKNLEKHLNRRRCRLLSRSEKGDLSKYMVLPVDSENSRFNCTACGSSFTVLRSLERHKRRRCSFRNRDNDKSYKCEACSRTFTEQNNLDRHTKTICTLGSNRRKTCFSSRKSANKKMKRLLMPPTSSTSLSPTVSKSRIFQNEKPPVITSTLTYGKNAQIKVESEPIVDMKEVNKIEVLSPLGSSENQDYVEMVVKLDIELSPVRQYITKDETKEEDIHDNNGVTNDHDGG